MSQNNAPSAMFSQPDRRRYPRYVCSQEEIEILLEQPGTGFCRERVQPADISAGGLGFYRNAFVCPGTRCLISFPQTGAPPLRVRGCVARCEPAEEQMHLVGIAFDELIDVAETHIADPNAMAESATPPNG